MRLYLDTVAVAVAWRHQLESPAQMVDVTELDDLEFESLFVCWI